MVRIQRRKLYRAATLIELVVVMTILVVLVSILLPVFSQVKARAQETGCMSNLEQTHAALELYHADYDEYPIHGNNAFLTYLGSNDLQCPSISSGSGFFGSYVLTAFHGPVMILAGSKTDYDLKGFLACRELRGADFPLAADVNHMPALIRNDDLIYGVVLVLRAGGQVSRVSRTRWGEVHNAALGVQVSPPVPCSPEFYMNNL